MANKLNEAGLFVVTDRLPQANLDELGLMVVFDATTPTAQSYLRELGLMVVFQAVASTGDGEIIQGDKIKLFRSIQGGKLQLERSGQK